MREKPFHWYGETRRPPLAVFLIPMAVVVYLAQFADIPINHDSALLIHYAQVLLRGGVPYIDVVEVNPPMSGWVHTLPVLVSKGTTLTAPAAFHLFVTLLVMLSCGQIWALLGGFREAFSPRQRLIFLGVWILGTLAVQLTLDYGQREHLFALFLLPWVLCRMTRYAGLTPRLYPCLTLGVAASPFFLLKPHFLAVVAGVDVILMLRSRRIRPLFAPETVLLGGWGLAYFVYLLTLPAQARDDLLHRWIPFLAHHYAVYNSGLLGRDNVLNYLWIMGVFGVSGLAYRYTSAERRYMIQTLSATVLLCLGAYLVQGKGWYYHHIPARLLALGLLASVLCGEARDIRCAALRRTTRAAAWALVCLPVIVTLFLAQGYRENRREYIHAMTAKIRAYAKPGDSVDFITSDVRPNYPAVVYAGVAPGTRYHCDVVIPMVYDGVTAAPGEAFPYRTPGEQPPDERRYLKELADDIAKRQPKLIAIDATPDCQACPSGFRIDEYLNANGWQGQAMAGYRLADSFRGFHFYVPK